MDIEEETERAIEVMHDEVSRYIINSLEPDRKPVKSISENISKEVEVSKSTVYRRMNYLEEENVVEEVSLVGDVNKNYYQLTDYGESIHRTLELISSILESDEYGPLKDLENEPAGI